MPIWRKLAMMDVVEARRPANDRRTSAIASIIVALGLFSATACGTSAAERLLPEKENPWMADQGRCSVRHSQSNPLIVEWPAADRGSLEMRLRRGIVVVRYEGCTMEVLRRCEVAGSRYRYGGFTHKTEQVRMRDADELYANLPVGAAKLEAKLETADALTVSMTMVGMFEADRETVALDDLSGPCEGATHIVTGVQVGAYAFYAERTAAIAGGAGLSTGPTLGAGSEVERETLTRDGDPQRCAEASGDDGGPPEGCGALLRLEVVPLGELRRAGVTCPDGTAWNGHQCESLQVARRLECPKGFVATGNDCRRPVCEGDACDGLEGGAWGSDGAPGLPQPRQRCPAGMSFVPGGALDDRTIEGFCLQHTEVTVAAYARCVAAGVCSPAADTVWWPRIRPEERDAASEACNAGREDRSQHPINCVTWSQAQAYCRWRGGALPTEAQWVWAAGGGTERRPFPWGEQPPQPGRVNACGTECRAWFQRRGHARERIVYEGDDGWATTAVVGSYPAGRARWGALDMAGNVAEWTAGPAEDPRKRRVRGGSFWVQRAAWLRNDDTIAADPERRDAVIGFRCAAAPSPITAWREPTGASRQRG